MLYPLSYWGNVEPLYTSPRQEGDSSCRFGVEALSDGEIPACAQQSHDTVAAQQHTQAG